MDPKLLRGYQAKQRPPVFLRDLPEPRTPEPFSWLIILAASLIALSMGLALFIIVFGAPHVF